MKINLRGKETNMDAEFIHTSIMNKQIPVSDVSLDQRLSDVMKTASEDQPLHDNTELEKSAAIALLFDMFLNYKR